MNPLSSFQMHKDPVITCQTKEARLRERVYQTIILQGKADRITDRSKPTPKQLKRPQRSLVTDQTNKFEADSEANSTYT